MKPKRPCSHPGCPRLTNAQYCEEHQKQADRIYDKARRPLMRKRYGKNWKHIRNIYFGEHPLCEECFKNNKLVPAHDVHHKISLKCNGSNDFSNLISLCKSCHSSLHSKDGSRWGKSYKK